jgi:hypothetical protein
LWRPCSSKHQQTSWIGGSLMVLASGRWQWRVLISAVAQDIPGRAGRDVTMKNTWMCHWWKWLKHKNQMESHLWSWIGSLLLVLASGRWQRHVLIPTVAQDIPGQAGRDITI